MTPDCHPIAVKSRNYLQADQEFIETWISHLPTDDIIEPSVSSWHAKVVIAQSENRKKRLCVDYSQTVNKFTHLDAYLLPSIQNIVSNVANCNWYFCLYLWSAYHQVPLLHKERKFSAFKANGRLYQFQLILFGLKKNINLLGYHISKGILQANPGNMKLVLDTPIPFNAKELQHMLGMFSYYAKWIPYYSEKIKPLVVLKKTPSEWWGIACFKYVKTDLSSATLGWWKSSVYIGNRHIRQCYFSDIEPVRRSPGSIILANVEQTWVALF